VDWTVWVALSVQLAGCGLDSLVSVISTVCKLWTR